MAFCNEVYPKILSHHGIAVFVRLFLLVCESLDILLGCFNGSLNRIAGFSSLPTIYQVGVLDYGF